LPTKGKKRAKRFQRVAQKGEHERHLTGFREVAHDHGFPSAWLPPRVNSRDKISFKALGINELDG